jgi:hypothetical protein
MTSENNPPKPSFKQRMDKRLVRWYKGQDPHPDPEKQRRLKFLASLVNKGTMQRYISGLGLPLPETIHETARIDEIDFASLPNRFVIKPNNSADSKGVILFHEGKNLLNGDIVNFSDLRSYVFDLWTRDKIFEKKNTRIIVEEFLQDYDPSFIIPRDFKVFAVAGEAKLIQVIDRNPPKGHRTNSCFSRQWDFIDQKMKTNLLQGPAYEVPPRLHELLEMADKISSDIRAFYRLDFFMTKHGPVFGEFTSYPSAGLAFTAFGDRLMCDLMDLQEDEF